jgi:GDPmannose 4,6-dehydratase
LGNLEAKRDWGYAGEYVEAMWRMLQMKNPDDYVIATGETHSVREFVNLAFDHAGIEIDWKSKGKSEKGVVHSFASNLQPQTSNLKVGNVLIEIDRRYFRPLEAEFLQGDASKAKKKLNWEPKVRFKELVRMMVDADIKDLEEMRHCQDVIRKLANKRKVEVKV